MIQPNVTVKLDLTRVELFDKTFATFEQLRQLERRKAKLYKELSVAIVGHKMVVPTSKEGGETFDCRTLELLRQAYRVTVDPAYADRDEGGGPHTCNARLTNLERLERSHDYKRIDKSGRFTMRLTRRISGDFVITMHAAQAVAIIRYLVPRMLYAGDSWYSMGKVPS